MALAHSFFYWWDIISSKYSGFPPSVSITYSCGGYLAEGHCFPVDVLKSGSTGGVGSFKGACSTSSAGPSSLSPPVPPWSSRPTGGETEVEIIGISGDDWDSSLFSSSPTI